MAERFLQFLENITQEELFNKIDQTYKELCNLEELKYEHAYGPGSESILEYISAVILLDLADSKEKLYIKGAIRLLIIGEFGPINFSDFIEYVAQNKMEISPQVWERGLKLIEFKFNKCLNCKIANKRIKKSKFIDMEEYIYILENVDVNNKFRKDKTEMEIESEKEVQNNKTTTKVKKKNSWTKVVVGLCVVTIIIGGGAYGIIAYKKSEKDKEVEAKIEAINNSSSETNNISETSETTPPTPTRANETDSTDDTYIIPDSNTRYLTTAELEYYTLDELGYVRNEIYARHGYRFKTEEYKIYFEKKSWYTPNYSFDPDDMWSFLTELEKDNVELIKNEEQYRSGS